MTQLNDATRTQNRAADPAASTWVTANAGSGKTRVLTDRVARLLLRGVRPEQILCLTYTKAAAAEMQNRLFAGLGAWAMMEDAALRKALAQLGEGADLPTEQLNAARRLFAAALEAPGGLKIQTIHAFCAAILRQFPLEAGVSPGFRELDDRRSTELRLDLLNQMTVDAAQVTRALAVETGGSDPEDLLKAIEGMRTALSAPFDETRLRAHLGLGSNETLEGVLNTTILPDDMEMLTGLIPVLEASTKKTDWATAETFAHIAGLEDRQTQIAALEKLLLTGATAASPYSAKIRALPTKAIWEAHDPAVMDHLEKLMLRVEAARPKRLALATVERARILHDFASRFLAAFEARKSAEGVLDFTDLIEKTRTLMADPAVAQWVLYRLDGRIRHILVDEAQDTAPPQWDVIRAIADAFFDGTHMQDSPRTLFVVGDEKQSIYSFQGAAPQAFNDMRDHFDTALDQAGSALNRVGLAYSFRSAAPILRVVDEMLGAAPGRAGLDPARSEDWRHRAFHETLPGRVELWPYVTKPEKPEQPKWYEPVDADSPEDPNLIIAQQTAAQIKELIGTPLVTTEGTRPVTPGDILILVRKRTKLFHPLLRNLKALDLPVAGADVLMLTDELAVKDILSLMRFAVTEQDDLSLAEALRSPLFGLSEDDLFRLAYPRGDRLLWAQLRDHSQHHEVIAALHRVRAAAFDRPYEMIDLILTGLEGRKKLIARLGPEAEDAIDELTAQAIAYERSEAPTITGFLHWLTAGEISVKREQDRARDEIRVMTVHGAKGLEAPIVILPECGKNSRDGEDKRKILLLDKDIPIWTPRASDSPEAVLADKSAQKQRNIEESERLLYVAMTRAENWLIVRGGGEEEKPPQSPEDVAKTSWHSKIAQAMRAAGAVEEGGRLVLQSPDWGVATLPEPAVEDRTEAAVTLPDWAHDPAPPSPAAAATVTPTELSEGLSHALPGEPDQDALARGTAIHRLLEVLPGLPDRAQAARSLGLTEYLEEVARVLDAPALGWVWGEALTELPFVLPLEGRDVVGMMDRVLIAPDSIHIVDFKSNRVVPRQPEEVPDGLILQLALYHLAAQRIWPDRACRATLLWTHDASATEIPHSILCAALSRAGIS
ncbi:ATP-dependent helicase/nuclease subunit A [Rubricella aquisinus]|uniref:DNA 3'-5' helicase n=1 Tax=Rubricella aquisinus TaxID=2028108 RepID=A0A840WFV3_9RHOB|nr:double-strand break repair helicase AddA [Rubricella aquisinus]MBB5514038.1 ATP-dependent helicase/nuclease subunit A [Rubricella aquisinus]